MHSGFGYFLINSEESKTNLEIIDLSQKQYGWLPMAGDFEDVKNNKFNNILLKM